MHEGDIVSLLKIMLVQTVTFRKDTACDVVFLCAFFTSLFSSGKSLIFLGPSKRKPVVHKQYMVSGNLALLFGQQPQRSDVL